MAQTQLKLRQLVQDGAITDDVVKWDGTKWVAGAVPSLDGNQVFIEGFTGSTIDLDANDGTVKNAAGTNVAFTLPSNLDSLFVYKNGIRLDRNGSVTRDYSLNTTTNTITFTVTLTTADMITIWKGTVGAGSGGSSNIATDPIWDAKGDLLAGTGANTATILSVGTNGYVLTADSAEATGIKWAASSGGFANPMTTLGDIIYGASAGAGTRLAGNTTTTKQFLSSTGNGSISAAPSWSTVTKSDVGLSAVENTALSTWAGTANITTLGAIGTGTWQGGVISSTYGGTGVNNGGRTLTLNTNSGTISFTNPTTTLTIANTGSISGTNTGDQTTIVGITGTKAQFDTAVTDGNFMYVGDAPTAHTLDSHSNVTITANSTGEILKWSGTAWINNTLAEAGIQPAGSYLTGNQTITLSGDVTGSGATAITTTIAAGAVDIAMLSATGTPSASTYLRGDNTWATVTGGSGDIVNNGQAGPITIGTNDATTLNFETNGTAKAYIDANGLVTFVTETSATTNADVRFVINTNSSGTPGAGFGGKLIFQGESATVGNRDIAGISGTWQTATDASRKGYLNLDVVGAVSPTYGTAVRVSSNNVPALEIGTAINTFGTATSVLQSKSAWNSKSTKARSSR